MKNQNVSFAGSGHGTLKGYLIGFILSVFLTVVPFILVINNSLSYLSILICIVAFAVIQIFVHLIYFLHLNRQSEGGWNLFALLFALLIIFIVVVGSLWIMYNLNINMMPE